MYMDMKQCTYAGKMQAKWKGRGEISIFRKKEISIKKKGEAQEKCEIIHVDIIKNKEKLNIIGVYNNHQGNINNCITESQDIIGKNQENTFIIGAFNVDMMEASITAQNLEAYFDSMGFLLCNMLPTRTCQHY